MTLWGVVEGKVNIKLYQTLIVQQHSPAKSHVPSITKGLRWAPLASFVYDIQNPRSVQTFPISLRYSNTEMTFSIFALEVHDNWGDPDTCLFKIGIYSSMLQFKVCSIRLHKM